MEEWKLKIELIPDVAHDLSLHNLVSSKIWKRIKRSLIQTEGERCWICGKEGIKLELHEYWEFNPNTNIQKLKEFHHLCYLCHGAKHLGYWYKKRDSKKKVAFAFAKKLERHFCEVNNCSKEDLKKHYRKIKKKRFNLGEGKIIIDFGRYSKLIPRLKREATKYLTEKKGMNKEIKDFISDVSK